MEKIKSMRILIIFNKTYFEFLADFLPYCFLELLQSIRKIRFGLIIVQIFVTEFVQNGILDVFILQKEKGEEKCKLITSITINHCRIDSHITWFNFSNRRKFFFLLFHSCFIFLSQKSCWNINTRKFDFDCPGERK